MQKIFVLVIVLLSAVVFAQSDYSFCDDLEARLVDVQEMAASLDGASEDLPSSLAELQSMITLLDADCRGLSFSSEVEGLQPVLGPIVFDGTYRVTFTTSGFGQLHGIVLDGDCDRDVRSLFNFSSGTADDGAQTVLQVESCEILLELDNITDEWTLTFEKLR